MPIFSISVCEGLV